MSSTPGSSSSTTPSKLSLVYTLTNVYNQFSFKLTVDGSRYKLWRQIFSNMCRGTLSYGHLSEKLVPTNDDDEEWFSVMIESSLGFTVPVIPDYYKLYLVMSVLPNNFGIDWMNSSGTIRCQMLQLQYQFRNTKKGSSSITEFCHTLKNLADDLKDVDSNITEIE